MVIETTFLGYKIWDDLPISCRMKRSGIWDFTKPRGIGFSFYLTFIASPYYGYLRASIRIVEENFQFSL